MPLPASVNPQWPLLRVLWCPTSNGVYDSDAAYYTDITRRCLKQWAISRGRQYELDTYMAGTFTATCKNADGALNPVSPNSPFAPYVTPYRRLLVEAQWPPTANRLTADQATAGQATPYAPGPIPAAMDVSTDVGATLTLAATATAWQGTQVYQGAVPAAAASGFSVIGLRHLPVETPGLGLPPLYYSWSAYIRSATAAANPSMAAQIKWFNASGAVVGTSIGSTTALTGAPAAPWVRVAVCAKPPAAAAWADAQLVLKAAVPATAWTFQADGAQFEQGGSASAWAQPGTWYPQFTGAVERYPQTTDLTNTRVLTPITATDVLALLPQSKLTASLNGLINTPNGVGGGAPDYLYTLGDSAGSTMFADSTGNRAAATIQNSKYGAGKITPGTAIASTDPGWGFLGAGANATVTRFTPGAGGSAGNPASGPYSMIDLAPDAVGQLGPPSTGGFTRMIAFRYTAVPGSAPATLWRAFATVVNGGTLLECSMSAGANSGNVYPFWRLTDGSNDLNIFVEFPMVLGDWYMSFIGATDDRMDGFLQFGSGSYFTAPFTTALAWPAAFRQDSLGATTIQSNAAGVWAFAGDIAYAAQWPFALTSAQMTEIYETWRTAYQGDSSDQRAGHILNWAKYTGPRALDAGVSTSLGPATDVDGIDALSALRQVQDTEGGQIFAAKDGAVTMHARSRRLGIASPTAVFGAHTGAGEIPYETCELGFDQALLENDVQITQSMTGQIYYGVNGPSGVAVGDRTYAKNSQSTDAVEVQSQADYYATEYGHAKVRVATLTLHPSALSSLYPAAWPVCLGLELDQCVQVAWRPPGSDVGAVDPVTVTGYVEKIDITGSGADALWTLQVSAAPGTGGGPSVAAAKPWNLALLHTTLHEAAPAGQPTVTIDALPTAAFSALAQNLPGGGPGWQLVLGSGLATEETLTIDSVAATSPGWTSAAVTFTANLAHAHDPGEIVREPLGSASAASWQQLDAYSVIDSMQITY